MSAPEKDNHTSSAAREWKNKDKDGKESKEGVKDKEGGNTKDVKGNGKAAKAKAKPKDSDAKDLVLHDPESDFITRGLQICVGFRGVWKKSLTELSGGQRSLLSLSLVLALLSYKPAPM